MQSANQGCNTQQRNTSGDQHTNWQNKVSQWCVRDRSSGRISVWGALDAASDVSVRPHQMRKILIYTPRDQTSSSRGAADAILVEMKAANWPQLEGKLAFNECRSHRFYVKFITQLRISFGQIEAAECVD